MNTLHIGNDTSIIAGRIIGITTMELQPIKRAVKEHKENGKLVDASSVQKARTAIYTDEGQIFLSIYSPDTIEKRINEI